MAEDAISRKATIDAINNTIKNSDMPFDWRQGMASALYEIRHLPSAQPEQQICDYCNEDSDGYVKPIEKNSHAFIRFGMNGWELSLKANGWHGSAKIRYCPMCGRNLLVK